MAERVGSLIVNLALESGAFSSGLSQAQKELKAATKRMEQMGQSLQDLGQKLTIGVTAPLVAFSAKAVQGFVAQEQAMAQVNAALKSMGDASGKTAGELSKAADALELNSLFDADVILQQVTANLLTFGNVAGEQFDRAQQAAVDMATRLGSEPQAAAMQLGKALNDPIKGISALTKVGIQFTAAQKAQIAEMVRMGDVAGAQSIILGEVERQFGGAAAAAADTSPWRKMQVALGQAGDAIGAQLLPMIKPVTDAIVSLLQTFNSLSPGVQSTIVVLGGLAAALGPVLMGVGLMVQGMAPFLGALNMIAGSGGLLVAAKAAFAGLAAALGPVLVPLAAVAAVAALIYANWDKVQPVLIAVRDALVDALGPPIQELVAAISDALSKLWNGPLGEGIRAAWPYLKTFAEGFARLWGTVLVGAIRIAGQVIGTVIGWIADRVRFITSVLDGTLAAKGVQAVKRLYDGVKLWLQAKLDGVLNWLADKLGWAGDLFFQLYDRVVGHSYIPDMVDGIAHHMGRLDREMVLPTQKATKATAEAFKQLDEDVRGLMGDLFPEARDLADFRKGLAAFDSAIARGGAGGYSVAQLRAGRQRLIDRASPEQRRATPLPLADQLRLIESATGPMLDIQGELAKLTWAANDNADAVGVANVRIAKSFKDMADQTLSALDRMASAVRGGGFLDILGAVIGLGLQLGSIGVFGKSVAANINGAKIPGYAGGTSFHPGGLAMVGERGPELVNLPRGSQVIPNHALGGAGGTRVEVVPSPYFDVRVQQNIGQAAPAIALAGARGGEARVFSRQARRVG